MSRSVSLYTTCAAILASEKIIGADRIWKTVNSEQGIWLDGAYLPCKAALKKGIPEIVSNATFNAPEHVAFLEKHGHKAQITECGPDEFLTAGIMKVRVEWVEEGQYASEWEAPTLKGIAAAKLEAGVKVFSREGLKNPIVRLDTKSGDQVFLTRIDTEADGLELARLATDLFAADGLKEQYSTGVVFPMVDLTQKRDLKFLKGLNTTSNTGKNCELMEALQQLSFKMNHKGAVAEAADEMKFALESMPPRPLVIDGDFLVSIVRPGLPLPLFTSYVTKEDWKDPGEI